MANTTTQLGKKAFDWSIYMLTRMILINRNGRLKNQQFILLQPYLANTTKG